MEDFDLSFLLEEDAVPSGEPSGDLTGVLARYGRRRRRHRAAGLVGAVTLAAGALAGTLSVTGGSPRLATAGPVPSGPHHTALVLSSPRGLEWAALRPAAGAALGLGSGARGSSAGQAMPGPCTVLYGCALPTSPPAEMSLLFARRVGDVEVRALLAVLPVLYPLAAPSGVAGRRTEGTGAVPPLPLCSPRQEVVVELAGPAGSSVAAVPLGSAAGEPFSTLAAVAVDLRGARPSLLVVARVGPAVARVELRVPGGGRDAMAPIDDVAVLLAPTGTRTGLGLLPAARRPAVLAVSSSGSVLEAVAVPFVPSIAEAPAWVACLRLGVPGLGGARPQPLAG